MLRLSWEQVEQLEAIVLKRHAASIHKVLAESWPAMTELLQERWPAFVEAAVMQGRRHGFVAAPELAAYASLWCIWGPAFEAKPAFSWAAEILSDNRRSTTLKLHQLAHRTRQELMRLGPARTGEASTVTAPQFDAALASVDRKVRQLAEARSIFISDSPPMAVQACDVGSIDMMLAEAGDVLEYRHAANGWQRLPPGGAVAAPIRWTRVPEDPVELSVTSHALRAGPPARLNLRVDAPSVCDARVHPEIVHAGVGGRLAWKGRDAARLSLALYALPPASEPGAALPGIGAETLADSQTVSVSSCGLRDAGAPFGDLTLQLRVYPATQYLAEVRHAAWPAMAWPGTQEPLARPAASSTLEADGRTVDAAAWQRAWAGLHAAFRQGMERVYNEWNRALGDGGARLDVEASPLVGQAGLAWGWRRTSPSAVSMAIAGALDLLALAIDMRLSGELAEGAARARIELHCKGRSELRMTIAQLAGQGPDGHDLKSASRTWRFPFVLEIEPLVGSEPGTLSAAATPVPITGALVGECGLRPRADGAGHQWFFALRLEPVSVSLGLADPLLGSARLTKKIFPAMSLVDWSGG
jgi:hypothetical protein